MKTILTKALAVVALSVSAGNTFFWQKQNSWGDWPDPQNWSIDPDFMSNPSSLVPGGSASDDKVHYQGYTYSGDNGEFGYLDLGGGDYTIDSFTTAGKSVSPSWKSYRIHLTNGTLRVTSQTAFSSNISLGFEVYDGAVLCFGTPTSPICNYACLGMYSYWNVRNGGRMEVRGSDLRMAGVSSKISAGGTLVFDPELFSVHNSATVSKMCKFDVYGPLIAPRGMLWNGNDIYTSSPPSSRQKKMYVYQRSGSTVYLGGDFAKTVEETSGSTGYQCDFRFFMEGGTLVTSNQVAFANRTSRYGTETFAEMTGSATVRTGTDSVLDMGIFSYSDGVTLTKEGPGTLKLRAMPPALAVTAGTVQFCQPVSGLSSASFANGVKIVFGTTGNAFAPPSNYADLDFALASGDFNYASADLLTSDNAAFLSYVKDRISSTVPAGKEIAIEDNAIKIRTSSTATLFWRASPRTWSNWGDADNWSLSRDSSYNPDGLVPGASGVGNPIFARSVETRVSDYGNFYGQFNLQGGTYALSGFSLANGEAGLNWVSSQFHVTNGTLTILNTSLPLESLAMSYYIWNGATFNYTGMGTEGVTDNLIGCSGLSDQWFVKPGGRFNVLGGLCVMALNVVVDAGGTLAWPTGRCSISKGMGAAKPFLMENSGTVELVNGLQWGAGDSARNGSASKQIIFRQLAGSVLFGGDFAKTEEESTSAGKGGRMSFEFSGGMLIATNDVVFANRTIRFGQETFASVADNASVSVRVLGADSKLDMRLFTYGSGASVSKDGDGLLTVSDLPSSLSVAAGAVEFGNAVTDLSSVSLADGVRVVFGAPGNAFTAPANYTMLDFGINTNAFGVGDVILASADAGFLNYVKGHIEAGCVLPPETKLEISGGNLALVADSANVFSGEGEFDLDDTERWSGGSVPENEDIFISGASTIARMSSGGPTFRSITLTGGATLKISDGVDLPPVNLSYPSTFSVAENASVVMTNGISSTGGATGLPVISVATNATLTVAAGTVFKNVDIRLYGTVTTDQAGILTFGGASAGELAYFAMTSIGGRILSIGWQGTGTANAYRRFVTPEDGGAVIVQGPLLFKDSIFQVMRPGTSSGGHMGTLIGYGNSASYPFEMILDNTPFSSTRTLVLEGGATLRLINGSVFHVGTAHPGVATLMDVRGSARISVEGPGSMLLLENADPYSYYFQPTAVGAESLVVTNGGLVAAHNTKGNGRAVVRVENGVWAVPNLPYLPYDKNPCPKDEDVRNWLTDLFNGFREVNVPTGRTLYIASADLMSGSGSIAPLQWDRDVKMANVPLTGGGDVVLTNTTPGYALSVTVVSGANTCTGRISGDASAADATTVRFADGANWAGTVVGDSGIAFTNLTDAAAPATVSFGRLELNGKMPIRVWNDGTSDTINLGSALSGNGRIEPVFMEGKPDYEVTFTLGRYPASAGVPDASFANHACKFSIEPIGGTDEVLLKVTWRKPGTVFTFR